jgi:hypothetical protein
MKGQTKIGILLAAVLLSLVAFNQITCSGGFCDILRAGHDWRALAAARCHIQSDVVVTAPIILVERL